VLDVNSQLVLVFHTAYISSVTLGSHKEGEAKRWM